MTVTRSKCQRGGNDGFGVVELLIATAILAFALIAFAAVLGAALRESTTSSVRTEARLAGTNRIEELRTTEYEKLGTVGGNPSGTVVANTTDGRFSLRTRIFYQNDPVPGQPFNSLRDYKVIRVEVTETETGKMWAAPETKVAPPGRPGLNEGIVRVSVMDEKSNYLEGASVNITGGPTPVENRTDATNAAGEVVFPGLKPAPQSGALRYTVTASLLGYRTDPDTAPPNSAVVIPLAASSTQNVVVKLIRDYQMEVALKQTNGAPYTVPNNCTAGGRPMLNTWIGEPDSIDVAGLSQTAITANPLLTNKLGSTYIVPEDYTLTAVCIPTSTLTTSGSSKDNPSANNREAWFSSVGTANVDEAKPLGTVTKAEVTMRQLRFSRPSLRARRGSTTVIPNAILVIRGGPADALFVTTTNSSGNDARVYLPQSTSNNDYEVTVLNQTGQVVGTTTMTIPGATTTPVIGSGASAAAPTITVTVP